MDIRAVPASTTEFQTVIFNLFQVPFKVHLKALKWEEKGVLQVVVLICSSMSPIMPRAVGPPGRFLP